MSTVTYRGGCHCGCVRFDVDAPARLEVLDCNCSMCSKTAYLHLIVAKPQFRLVALAEVVVTPFDGQHWERAAAAL